MLETGLTALNRYELTGSAEAFDRAVEALAARVRAEGHRGVLGYRFFRAADGQTARAVVDYSGPEAWIGHHDIAMSWPEMQALHASARLVEVVLLGQVTQDIRDWLAASRLTAQVVDGFAFAAGFRRPADVQG